MQKEYGLGNRQIVRPFYPGGDYQLFYYPDGCVVVDNPPFSILSKILDWYNAEGIDYFLFAPALTVISTAGQRANSIITDSSIIYENKANVKTAFVTNLGPYKIHVSSELFQIIDAAQRRYDEATSKQLPKYDYPNNVLQASTIQKIASLGQSLKIEQKDCHWIRGLDSQRREGKTIFGSGFLLSEKAAAEKAAAEKVNFIVWELSEREKKIIANLGGKLNE